MPSKTMSVVALAAIVGAAAAASKPVDPAVEVRRLTVEFEYVGCYVDGPNPHTMGNQVYNEDGMTTEICAEACAEDVLGSMHFGTPYGDEALECFCVHEDLTEGLDDVPEGECSSAMYKFTGGDSTPATPEPAGGGGDSTPATPEPAGGGGDSTPATPEPAGGGGEPPAPTVPVPEDPEPSEPMEEPLEECESAHGIQSLNGQVCCLVKCGQCDGSSCLNVGDPDCCVEQILEEGLPCSETGAAPCFIDEGDDTWTENDEEEEEEAI